MIMFMMLATPPTNKPMVRLLAFNSFRVSGRIDGTTDSMIVSVKSPKSSQKKTLMSPQRVYDSVPTW